MYWVALAVFFVCVGALVVDWRQTRELLPAGLSGIVLSGISLVADVEKVSWLPVVTGKLDRVSITLLQQTIIAPVVSIWFAQGFNGKRTYPAVHILKFMAMSLSLEAVGAVTGHIIHSSAWSMGFSALCYAGWYSAIWWVQSRISMSLSPQAATKAPPG